MSVDAHLVIVDDTGDTPVTRPLQLTDLNPPVSGDQIIALATGREVNTAPGTPKSISDSSVPCKWVEVQAVFANTGLVAIGGTDVSADVTGEAETGILLGSGERSGRIPITNAAAVYFDVADSGDGVTFIAGVLS